MALVQSVQVEVVGTVAQRVLQQARTGFEMMSMPRRSSAILASATFIHKINQFKAVTAPHWFDHLAQ